MKAKRDIDGKLTNGTNMDSQARRPDVCWPWFGARSGLTPVMRVGSTTKSVRKVLWELEFGPLVNRERVWDGRCGNLLCVNPHHATMTGIPTPEPEPVPPTNDVEDCIDLILSLEDEDRTLPVILDQGWPYARADFEAALARIASEGL